MSEKQYRIRNRARKDTCIPDPSYLIFWKLRPEGGYTQQPVNGFNICKGKKLYMSNKLFGGVASPFKPGVLFKDVQQAWSFGMRCYYKYSYSPQKGMEEMNKLEQEYLAASEKIRKQKEEFSQSYEALKANIGKKGAINTFSELLSGMSEQNNNEKKELVKINTESKKYKATDYSSTGSREIDERATNLSAGLDKQIEKIDLENETIAGQQAVVDKIIESMAKSGASTTTTASDPTSTGTSESDNADTEAVKIQNKSIMMN